jgi:hypothetical protein
MVAPNHSYAVRQTASKSTPQTQALKHRLRSYFDAHPQVSREEFLVGALQGEIDSREPLTAKDMRIHAWLIERQAILDRERNGWRSRARRLFHL